MPERRLDTIWTPSPHPRGNRTLLVMLPGAHLHPSDFARHGFLADLHARRGRIDVAAVDLKPDDYLDGDPGGRLHRAVIGPALERGYQRLWLLGISLGGMGALLYARAHQTKVDGIILLAPFLATRGTIAEALTAGGLAAWEPGPLSSTDLERGLLGWLKSRPFARGNRPKLLLGHGNADRYADASRLLARHMPPDRLEIAEGGHDWPTWTTLWRRLLEDTGFDG